MLRRSTSVDMADALQDEAPKVTDVTMAHIKLQNTVGSHYRYELVYMCIVSWSLAQRWCGAARMMTIMTYMDFNGKRADVLIHLNYS